MKRSRINRILREAAEFIDKCGFALPPFARFTDDDWRRIESDAELRGQYAEIADNMLGWDVTDFGSGEFERVGLTLFTLRNGNYNCPDVYPKPYAEKIMVIRGRQITPFHYHAKKMEDIINRGEGALAVTLYNSAEDGGLSDTPVSVHSDGRVYTVPAGSTIMLERGQSITMTRGLYHQFCGADDRMLLIGEVSCVNDDNADNVFLEKRPRFMEIDEDAPKWRRLCNEVFSK